MSWAYIGFVVAMGMSVMCMSGVFLSKQMHLNAEYLFIVSLCCFFVACLFGHLGDFPTIGTWVGLL